MQPKWFEAGAKDYGFPPLALLSLEFLLLGFLELKRYQGFKKPPARCAVRHCTAQHGLPATYFYCPPCPMHVPLAQRKMKGLTGEITLGVLILPCAVWLPGLVPLRPCQPELRGQPGQGAEERPPGHGASCILTLYSHACLTCFVVLATWLPGNPAEGVSWHGHDSCELYLSIDQVACCADCVCGLLPEQPLSRARGPLRPLLPHVRPARQQHPHQHWQAATGRWGGCLHPSIPQVAP